VTTPREQLIEAMANALLTPRSTVDELQGREGSLHFYRAVTALNALEDLGAVVLTPVKEGQSVANVIVLDEKHVLRTTQEERNEGVYINALESQQS